MNPETSERIELGRERIPRPVCAILEALDAAGWRSFLVGRCVRELLQGHAARDFEVATPASPKHVLALFPHAVPTEPRFATVTVPSAAGPVDVAHFRAGTRLEDDLSLRDFRIHAMAFDVRAERLSDPFSGRADLAARRLRAVGSAQSCVAADPVRALRAARLVALLGFEADADLERAMGLLGRRLLAEPPARLRPELAALLRAPHVELGLDLLRRTGIAAILFPGVAADSARVVSQLPDDLELRLAAWLRGTRAASGLRRLRFPRSRVAEVEALLRLHPVDRSEAAERPSALRRLRQRMGARSLERLVALREAEIAARDEGPRAVEALDAFRASLAREQRNEELTARRTQLALDGGAVMEQLGCGPGPRVGRALRFLAERISADPSLNEPDSLRALLGEWARANPK